MTLPMQKATYRAVATSTPISFGRASTGTQSIAVEFEILAQNEQTNEYSDSTGETITWIGHFTNATADRTIEALIHAGWQGEDPSDLNDKPASSELPTSVDLVCEPEQYEGQWQLKVRWVNKPGAGRFAFKETMSDGELKAFGAQLRANVKAVRAAGGAPRTAKQSNSSSGRQSSPHPNAPGSRHDDEPERF